MACLCPNPSSSHAISGEQYYEKDVDQGGSFLWIVVADEDQILKCANRIMCDSLPNPFTLLLSLLGFETFILGP